MEVLSKYNNGQECKSVHKFCQKKGLTNEYKGFVKKQWFSYKIERLC
jgi:hypothetical protein